MLNNEFKKSATEKLKSMDSNEFKKAFKAIGSELQTNEEWFCGLSTEEKAKFFSYEMRCEFCPNQEKCDSLGANCKVLWESWLKQPHTNE